MANLIFNSDLYGPVAAIPYPVADGAIETLEYYTDVLNSYTNEAEERAQMRALPRQTFQYKHDASLGNMQEIHNAVYANLRGKWLVPLWFELQQATATLGQTEFAVDTLLHDLRADSYALIFQSICKWQVVKVSAITDTSITCEASTIAGRVFIVPYRVGFLAGNANGTPTGYKNSFELNFVVEDVLSGLTELPTQYNGQDLYTVPYLMDEKGSVKIIKAEDQVEYSVGNIAHSTPWADTQYAKQYVFDGQGAADMRAFKNYFYRRAGRYRPFYSPSFESNLQSRSTGLVASTFKFKDEGYTDNLFASIDKLGFLLKDGTWAIRTVSDPAHIGAGVDQLTLSSALNVQASDIVLASFVKLNRLDSDRIELKLGQNEYFRTSVNVVEIPE